MMTLLLLPAALLGAITFRIRGGLLETVHMHGQLARLSWAIACGLAVLAGAGLNRWLIGAVVLDAWVASTLPLFGAMDAGHREGTPLGDYAWGLLHGLMMATLVAIPLCAFDRPSWWLVLIGGAMWPVCYAAVWQRPAWPEIQRLRLGRTGEPPEAAELLFGFVFACFLFVAAAP